MTKNLALLLLVATIGTGGCVPSTAGTPKAGSPMPVSIVDPYLKIHDALADDSAEGVKGAAGDLVTASTALGAPALRIQTSAMQLSAEASAAEPDLAKLREKFGTLSEAVDTYMKGESLTPPEGVRVAVCPMNNKPWMQKGDTISNPYYGKEMPTCGNFR